MSQIAQVTSNVAASTYETAATQKKSKVSGKTIGEPKLTEQAAKYYEELKKKYSNMDFILVSKDQKEQAQSQAGNYANANKMVVLIDEEKIERMATDENYRKQYEGIIGNAALQLPQMQSSLSSSGANVKGYGIQVNDNGTASYFAVIDKSLAAQKTRIEKKAAQNREDKKEAAEAAAQKRLEEIRTSHKNTATDKTEGEKNNQGAHAITGKGDNVTVTASSMEELLQKIQDTMYAGLSDVMQTDVEKMMGQNIDFKM